MQTKEKLVAWLNEVKCNHKGHTIWHGTYVGGHLAYFGTVFLEGHTIYALIAGCLFVVVIVGLLLFGEG